MERDWCGAWWRGALSSRGVCLWQGVMTSSGWRGTGAEHGGGLRWALAEFFCVTEYWRRRDAAIGATFVDAQKGRENSSLFLRSTFRQMSKEREQEVIEEKMSEGGSLEVRRGTGECFEGPARRASYEGKAREKTPRRSCQTIQRNQRAEGRAPHS